MENLCANKLLVSSCIPCLVGLHCQSGDGGTSAGSEEGIGRHEYTCIAFSMPTHVVPPDELQPGVAPGQPNFCWGAEVIAQKLQLGNRRFTVYDIFGVKGKAAEVDQGSAPMRSPRSPRQMEAERQAALHAQIVDDGQTDCIICMSEPRDTAVLPCRHMCFCSHCASIMRSQCERCPICRQRVASMLQFERQVEAEADNNSTKNEQTSAGPSSE